MRGLSKRSCSRAQYSSCDEVQAHMCESQPYGRNVSPGVWSIWLLMLRCLYHLPLILPTLSLLQYFSPPLHPRIQLRCTRRAAPRCSGILLVLPDRRARPQAAGQTAVNMLAYQLAKVNFYVASVASSPLLFKPVQRAPARPHRMSCVTPFSAPR